MSIHYKSIDWNPYKNAYDLTLAGLVAVLLGAFVGVSLVLNPNITAETLILRGTATSALILLHVILCIGPLARLDRRFLPFLYNRRHLGVTMFLLSLVHAALAIFQFHALGDLNPFVSVLTAYRRDYLSGDVADFPFEIFGLITLAILFLMAATSHDFWLKVLGASFWKTLHMAVYLAYGSLLIHVIFGALQSERSVVYPVLLACGFMLVAGLHLAAARREIRFDRRRNELAREGFAATCEVGELTEGQGKVVLAGAQRVALWLKTGRVFATSNVCRHQGGPVGEGRLLDGCITCPWHGWNYRPEDGCSPPPFAEVIETFDVRIENGRVWVKTVPNQMGAIATGAVAQPDSVLFKGDAR